MSTALEKCQQQAKHLSFRERALLIQTLIEDLEDLDERNLEQLWIKECSRRFQEYKAGNIEARPGEEVFNDARKKLQGMQ